MMMHMHESSLADEALRQVLDKDGGIDPASSKCSISSVIETSSDVGTTNRSQNQVTSLGLKEFSIEI
jgi:hypothetical protein